MLAVGLAPHRQQAGLAEHAVGIGDVIDRRDRIFAGHEPERLLVAVGRVAAGRPAGQHGVQVGHRLLGGRAVGPGLLGGVIEVRQVDVEEVGLPLAGRQRGRSAIQAVEWMLASGPQKCFSGKWPSSSRSVP